MGRDIISKLIKIKSQQDISTQTEQPWWNVVNGSRPGFFKYITKNGIDKVIYTEDLLKLSTDLLQLFSTCQEIYDIRNHWFFREQVLEMYDYKYSRPYTCHRLIYQHSI